ncbi:MAG: thioesterase family protein [Tahibacter sp.]
MSKQSAPSADAELRLLARVPIRVRWRDLDAFNHVNNANFLTYLEEARLVWLSGIEGPWFGATWMPVLAATNVNYRAQIEWPGEVVVELYCQRIGQSSVTVAHRIVSAVNHEHLHSDGNVVMVWIEPATGRSVPLPDSICKACS